MLKQTSFEEIEKMERLYRAAFINSLSGFKSVNLVGTTNKGGVLNLSVVSSVVHLGANPPLMGFIMRPVSVQRDTYENIQETGEYTFNHLHEEIFKNAHQAAARFDKNISEFEQCDLEPEFSSQFLAPYVKESNIRIGLKKVDEYPIKQNGTLLIVGEVKEVFYPEQCLHKDGYLDIEQSGSLTVSGLDSYHETTQLARLSYPKPDKNIEVIHDPNK